MSKRQLFEFLVNSDCSIEITYDHDSRKQKIIVYDNNLMNQQQDELKRQQDELIMQQDELKRQQDELKRQHDELNAFDKYISDTSLLDTNSFQLFDFGDKSDINTNNHTCNKHYSNKKFYASKKIVAARKFCGKEANDSNKEENDSNKEENESDEEENCSNEEANDSDKEENNSDKAYIYNDNEDSNDYIELFNPNDLSFNK
jgi:hypothetical protein